MTTLPTRMTFRITFLGPFHIGSGSPDEGLDSPVDREVPLPASGLKGLMRAQAQHQAGVPVPLVEEIFGSRSRESAWLWTDAAFAVTPEPEKVARLKLADTDDGAAETGFLMLAEHLWATEATFTVSRRRVLTDDELRRHRLVLRAAARSISGLGGSRRRGEGWVTVVDLAEDDSPTTWTVDESRQLLKLTEVPA